MIPDAAILVAGTGRWARVFLREILLASPPASTVKLLATRRVAETTAWLSEEGLGPRVEVVGEIPTLAAGAQGVAFVVNSAHEHAPTSLAALAKGYHVVTEKPFALSLAEFDEVVSLAGRVGRSVFPVLTYRFASYLDSFRARLGDLLPATEFQLIWRDPVGESRHGGFKRYDPKVPIFLDLLPHVAAILETVSGFGEPEVGSLAVSRGGAELELLLKSADHTIRVELSRVADVRCRRLVIGSGARSAELDFSQEPGTARIRGELWSDPTWTTARKPIASVLASVREWLGHGRADPRFDLALARRIQACIDRIRPAYRARLDPWVWETAFGRRTGGSEDLEYALLEVLGLSRPPGDRV